MAEPYAEIHHFGPNCINAPLDDDGDTMQGWYFQIMLTTDKSLTAMIGPYGCPEDCEEAAIEEWQTLPYFE